MKTREALAFRSCDEGVLMYDEASGATSLLNQQGSWLLQVLSSEKNIDEVLALAAFDMNEDQKLSELQSLLSSLQNSGLIVS